MIRPPKSFAGVSRRRRLLLIACLLSAVGAGVWAMVRPAGRRLLPEQEALASPRAAKGRGRNVALQPAALALGRRLGQRFLKAGREVSVLEGTLTTGADSRRVVVRRTQDDGGEEVEIQVAGRGAPLTWDAANGVFQAGRPADAEAADLAGRLALDAPDQFVLAQLRGAGYLVVARNVRADEGGGEDYTGPLQDVVRVGEPGRREGEPPAWRLYYINSATGLLDKVVSGEGGGRVEAVLSGWAEHAGELQPSRVTWSRQGQVFMELSLTNVVHGPKQ